MKFPALLFFLSVWIAPLGAAVPAKASPQPAESKAQAELKTLVERQRLLLVAADKATEQAAVEDLRPQFQKLVFAYEQYLKDYPDVAAGYVSYALLLGKPLLGESKRAAALLLKANQLDPNLPVVKNQLGNFLAEDGKPLEAVSYFLAAIKLAPEEPLYHYQLGTLLAEARDDFLQSGEWKRPALDDAMQAAFRQAMTLAPERIAFAYRYGESFYDLETPDWVEALKFWRALEGKVSAKLEKQTVRLHEANVLLKQGQAAEARILLATVGEPALEKQKQKLVALLNGEQSAASAAEPAAIKLPSLPTQTDPVKLPPPI